MGEEGFDGGEVVFRGCEVEGVLCIYLLEDSLMDLDIGGCMDTYLAGIALDVYICFFPEHEI